MTALPLFDFKDLKALQREREELSRKLRRGGIEAHSRIRMQQKLNVLTARQVRLESQLGLGSRNG